MTWPHSAHPPYAWFGSTPLKTGKRSMQLQAAASGESAKRVANEKDMMMSEVENDRHLLEQSLIDLAVESWRFSRLFARLVNKIDAGESARYLSQLRYFQKKTAESLDANGLWLVTVEKQPFETGMAISPINIGDFAPDDELLVDQMVEPIVMGPGGVIRPGTALLVKVAS